MNEAEDFTASEIEKIQSEFRLRASRVKKLRWLFLVILLTFIALWIFILVKVPTKEMSVPLIGGIVVILAISLLIGKFRSPRCSGCEGAIEDRWGSYCPACGADNLEVYDSLKAQCVTCKSELGFSSPAGKVGVRLYKIYACTHCGVKLTESGF